MLAKTFVKGFLTKVKVFSTQALYNPFYLQSRASSLVLSFVSLWIFSLDYYKMQEPVAFLTYNIYNMRRNCHGKKLRVELARFGVICSVYLGKFCVLNSFNFCGPKKENNIQFLYIFSFSTVYYVPMHILLIC